METAGNPVRVAVIYHDSGPGESPKLKPYVETFDQGHGGWYRDRYYALPVWDGVAYSYSPWWLDANHAPPGAGYLHLVMWTYTDKRRFNPRASYTLKLPYRGSIFAEQGHSTNLTNARLTVRLRGDVDLKGSQLLFLVQAETPKTTAAMVLTGQPFNVTHDWSEQTVILKPDPKEWTCLGARHDMRGDYGCDDIGTVLSDVNYDIIFILFPVRAVPACPGVADINQLRAVADYPVKQEELPKGVIMVDTIRLNYPF